MAESPTSGVRPTQLADIRDDPPLGDLWRTLIELRDRPYLKRRMRWVLSQETLDEIEKQARAKPGYSGDPVPPDAQVALFGRPVRVDESATGVTYEVMP